MKERTGERRGGPMREAKTRKGGDRREGGRPRGSQQQPADKRPHRPRAARWKKEDKEGGAARSGDPKLSYSDRQTDRRPRP